jgi:hypothetical protein
VSTVRKAHAHSVPAGAVAILVASLAVGAVLGVLRGVSVRVWRRPDGTAWRQGSAVTAGLWLVSLAAHVLAEVLADHRTSIDGLGSSTLLIYLAVTLGIQREIVRVRAAKLPGGTN